MEFLAEYTRRKKGLLAFFSCITEKKVVSYGTSSVFKR